MSFWNAENIHAELHEISLPSIQREKTQTLRDSWMCHGSTVLLYRENGHCTFHDGNLIIGISNSIKLPCKTNMSPETQWLEDVFPIEIAHFQRTFVSFRRVYWVNEPIPISSITVTVVGELLHSTTESLPIPWIIWGSYSWGRFLPSLRKPWDLIHPKFHMESPFFPVGGPSNCARPEPVLLKLDLLQQQPKPDAEANSSRDFSTKWPRDQLQMGL